MDEIVDEKRYVLIRNEDGKFFKFDKSYKARNWIKDILGATLYKTELGAVQNGRRIKYFICDVQVGYDEYWSYVRSREIDSTRCKRTNEFDAEQFEVKNINVTIR